MMQAIRYPSSSATRRLEFRPDIGIGARGPKLAPWLAPVAALYMLAGSVDVSKAAGDWPRFRGPGGMGQGDAANLPATWSADEHVVWKTDLPGPGASSPIVVGDRIYVTCWSGYLVPEQETGRLEDLVRHLVAVRRDDGTILWNQAVPARQPEEKRIRDHGYAANTPVADREGVVVFFGTSGVRAYGHDGSLLWEADVGSDTSGWGTSASPVLWRDLVLINACVESESLVALDRRTGRERWRADGIRESWSTPLVVNAPKGREELVLAAKPRILAFEPATGKPLWTCDTDIPWYMVPSVVASDGVVYALGGRSGIAGLAVRAGGSGDVTATHRLWTSEKGSNVTSPVVVDGHLYWMHEKRETAYCADVRTGDLVYEEPIPRAGQIYASPVVADGKIYYLNRSGTTYVVAADPRFDLLASNRIDDGSSWDASPAVQGNRLWIRSNKALYCLGR